MEVMRQPTENRGVLTKHSVYMWPDASLVAIDEGSGEGKRLCRKQPCAVRVDRARSRLRFSSWLFTQGTNKPYDSYLMRGLGLVGLSSRLDAVTVASDR